MDQETSSNSASVLGVQVSLAYIVLLGSLGKIQDDLKISWLQYEILECLYVEYLEMFHKETFGNNNQLLEIKRVNIASTLIFFEKLLQSGTVMKILLYCIWGILI